MAMNTLKTLVLSSAVSLLTLTAAQAEQLKVVATFSIIGDFAKEVGGDRIALTTLVGPGGDAHVYQAKPADAVAVKNADVVLVNGLHFEGFLDRLIETSETKATVAELSRGIDTLKTEDAHEHGHDDKAEAEHDHKHEKKAEAGHDHDHGKKAEAHDHDHKHDKKEAHKHDHDKHGAHAGHSHGEFDPHAFQSVANAKIYVSNVAQAFCTADAAGCDTYKANAAAYNQKLDALETEVKATLSAIPEERRTVITSHEAFAYFGKAYDIKFLAPEGVSTEAEASAADVAALIRQVREDKASAIFVENITNSKLIEQIASETGLKIGGTLYSDALTDGAPAGTYIDLIRTNAETIKGAVSGS